MNEKLKNEMIIIEKICLIDIFENKYRIFKKIKACDQEFLISKN